MKVNMIENKNQIKNHDNKKEINRNIKKEWILNI